MPRKVCVVLVDRANYGRLKPVMEAVQVHPQLTLQTLAAGTMVLERFDLPLRMLQDDGFELNSQIYVELEGSNPATMAKSIGFGVIEFASEFARLKPDLVLLIGDRYETLSAAIAAAYMNLCIVHIQGGEVSGSIDESARHAITKFAHYHFPSTLRSAEYLVRMGERPDTVLGAGCPSSDIARTLDCQLTTEVINSSGSGAFIDPAHPYLLVIFHPTTTEFGDEQWQVEPLLEALAQLARPTVLLWPNIDAGSNHVSKAIRRFRDTRNPPWLRLLINLRPTDYLKVLANAACAVGNSSSFVRDASYFGTPVVLVGRRQEGRETDRHVWRVPEITFGLEDAIQAQLEHGRYPASTLYGDGFVAKGLAHALATLTPYVQKSLHYLHHEPDAPVVPTPSGNGKRHGATTGAV